MLFGGLGAARAVMMPTVLILVAMFSTSLYFTFRDSFLATPGKEDPQPASPEGESTP
jgi:hypothetical protein